MKGLTFSEPMMVQWLAGNKSLTRRLMNPQPVFYEDGGCYYPFPPLLFLHQPQTVKKWRHYATEDHFRKGVAVDFSKYCTDETVYIKETWRTYAGEDDSEYEHPSVEYKSDNPGKYPDLKYKSPRFMPEWASRSHAMIKSVRPERIQEITVEEIIKEGFSTTLREHEACCDLKEQFQNTWESLHPGSWERNDWVWRYELEKL